MTLSPLFFSSSPLAPSTQKQKMATNSDFPEEEQSPPPPSAIDGPLDNILKQIVDKKPALGVIETVIDFLGRKSDLFKDENVDSKIQGLVSAAKKGLEERKRKAEERGLNDVKKPEKRLKEAADVAKKVEKDVVKEKEDDTEKANGKRAPNSGKGSDFDNYSWTQTLQKITVNVPIPDGTKSRFVVCEIKKDHLTIGLEGQPPILDGDLYGSVEVDDCFWSIEPDTTRERKTKDKLEQQERETKYKLENQELLKKYLFQNSR